MGLFRRKWMQKHHDQASFDLIDLDQFHSTSCRYVFSYFFMYVMIIISLAVYGSDIYTAIVLLAFNKWSSEVDPKVPFHISKWIFAGCIILSFVLLIYEYIVAWTTMKRKNVAMNYTHPIARNLWSIYNYDYFCLFAKITKARSKTEYVALFVYFTFKGWIRLIFADSPRQVLNAMTLYSVLKVDGDILETIKSFADHSVTQAVVLGFMTFSLVVWVVTVIQFIIALLCAFPLYVHIDKSCSGLEEYCCVRINRRISHLVQKHHKKGLMELKEANKKLAKQPTLPTVVLDNDEQTDERFEDILGEQGQSTKKYIAFKKDAELGNISRNGSNSSAESNPFRGLEKPQEGRSGYGYAEPTNSSAASLLQHNYDHTPQHQPSLRSHPSTRSHQTDTIQQYPGPARTLTNQSSGSMGPVHAAMPPVANRSILRNGSGQQQMPPPNNEVSFGNAPVPIRSASNAVQVQQNSSPEATLPPSTVMFDQYDPQSPGYQPQNGMKMPMPAPTPLSNNMRPPQQQQQQHPPMVVPQAVDPTRPDGRHRPPPVRTDIAQAARPSNTPVQFAPRNGPPSYAHQPPPPVPQPRREPSSRQQPMQPLQPQQVQPPHPVPTPAGQDYTSNNAYPPPRQAPMPSRAISPPQAQRSQQDRVLSFSQPMPQPTLPKFDIEGSPTESSFASPQSTQPPAPAQPYHAPRPANNNSQRQPTLPKFDLDDM